MVQGFDIIQIDVAFLTYNALREISNPTVKLDTSCVAGMHEIVKHREHKRRHKQTMGVDAYIHYKWYNSTLQSELRDYNDLTKLRIIHWRIESGNSRAFHIENIFYKTATVIIGPRREHWYCANTIRDAIAISGRRRHICNYSDILKAENTLSKALVVKKVENENKAANRYAKHCTKEFCANNCLKCQKYISPFSAVKICACFRQNDKTDDEEDDDEDDIVYFNKNINQNLGTIREEC